MPLKKIAEWAESHGPKKIAEKANREYLLSREFLTGNFFAGLLTLFFLGIYVLTEATLAAVLTLAAFLFLVVKDLLPRGEVKEDLQDSLWDTIVAVLVAVGAWLLLGFVLQTSSPINVVTSCSMVPMLERGDVIFLQGGSYNVPEVELKESLANAEYRTVAFEQEGGKAFQLKRIFVDGKQVAEFEFGECEIRNKKTGEVRESVCTQRAVIAGKTFGFNESNDVIVYNPKPVPFGLVIHRAIAKIRATDGVYYLTKGDNNPFFDQESGIYLVPEGDVLGKSIARVPYLGLLKLFLFLQFDPPAGCEYVCANKAF